MINATTKKSNATYTETKVSKKWNLKDTLDVLILIGNALFIVMYIIQGNELKQASAEINELTAQVEYYKGLVE